MATFIEGATIHHLNYYVEKNKWQLLFYIFPTLSTAAANNAVKTKTKNGNANIRPFKECVRQQIFGCIWGNEEPFIRPVMSSHRRP